MTSVKINLGSRTYNVLIGKDILSDIGSLIEKNIKIGKLLLVSDSTVFPLYGQICRQSLGNAGFEVITAEIPAGEENKNMTMVQKMYDAALEAGLDRQSPIVALGGGVVGDLAGFVASTYMRGVPFIQVPTTLLAQVDSSVGGKTGVNHPRGKNLIGAFYQPQQVIIDIASLDSLPEREYRAGLAEVIKYGLIGDRDFFDWLETNFESLLEKDPKSLIHAITCSVKNKARVVESDERESGRRKILNLGHTFGHALEAATDYKYYLHGEAVLIGMEMAISLAEKLDMLDHKYANRIREVLRKTGLKKPPPGLATEAVFQKLAYDKKREGTSTVFILPVTYGEAVTCPNPPEDMIEELIDSYLGE